MQRSYNLIRELSKYHDVTLLAFNQQAIVPIEKVPGAVEHFNGFCKGVEIFDIVSEKSTFLKIFTLIRGLLPWNTYNTIWLESSEYERSLAEKLQQEKFDLIHVDTISLVPFVKNLDHLKRSLNHHNIESLMMLRRAGNEKNFFKKVYFLFEGFKLKQLERKYCGQFNINITCSSVDTNRLRGHAAKINCVDIPNGVDLDYFNKLTCSRSQKTLIFVGGLNWYPNYDAMKFFLNEIWPLLLREIPDVTMKIVGASPPQWMLDYASKCRNLSVLGFVDDVRPYLSEAQIYVCPIRDGGGTKLKVLDALAMEIPLVADPIACEGIDVVDGRSVLFASEPQDYVVAIKRLVSDQGLSESLAREGRVLIERSYGFREIGKKLATIYENI